MDPNVIMESTCFRCITNGENGEEASDSNKLHFVGVLCCWLFDGSVGREKRRESAADGSESSVPNNIRRTTLDPPLSSIASALTEIMKN